MISEEQLNQFKHQFEIIEAVTSYKVDKRLHQIECLSQVYAPYDERIQYCYTRIEKYKMEYLKLRAALLETIELRESILHDAELPAMGLFGAYSVYKENHGDLSLPKLTNFHQSIIDIYAPMI